MSQDLSAIGRIIGIPGCMGEDGDAQDRSDVKEIRKLQKALGRKHRLKSRELQGKVLTGIAINPQEDPRAHIRLELMKIIGRHRTQFAGRVIRRSGLSVDNEGKSVIAGLPDLTTVIAAVVLPEHEEDEMHRRAAVVESQ